MDVAADGSTALFKATDTRYDVIVLDVMLPRLSGYEVLKRLRAAGVWTPVLMLTAKDGDYDIADALDLGADDYLAKPFSFVVLLARLRALQRRGGRERPAVLSAGDLVLDPARRRCARGETRIALTAREFAVLDCLIRRRGEVVGKVLAATSSSATTEASQVAAALNGRDQPALPRLSDQAALVQVLDAAGRVVAASSGIQGEPPLFSFAAPPAGDPAALRTVRVAAADGAPYRVAALSTSQPPRYRVYLGLPVSSTDRDVAQLAAALAVGGPALLAALAALTWLLAGQALRPAEVLRRQAAAVSATDLHRRVDVPGTDDELARLARTLNDLLDQLERSLHRQRRFVADAAHELRSPTASLQALLETAADRDGRLPADLLPVLTREAGRLAHLVDDLLALARLDVSRPPHRETVDLDDIVFAEVRVLRLRARVPVEIAGVHAARVDGDPGQLNRVVRNLLDNAERYATSAVRVRLDTEGDGTVVLTVSDDGVGIASRDRERIFERFTRLDESRARDAGGVGLGLAIVRDAVHAHGGSIGVEDNAPGARFVVRLPVRAAAGPQPAGR